MLDAGVMGGEVIVAERLAVTPAEPMLNDELLLG